MKRWLVIDIGCLECGHPTDVLGMFDTLDGVFGARVAFPHAKLRSEMDDGKPYGDWDRESVQVIFDLEAQR